MAVAPGLRMTVAQYLAFERESQAKHEFYCGAVLEMSGGSSAHGLVASNLPMALAPLLKGKVCRYLGPDVRFAPLSGSDYFYPDAMIACPPRWIDSPNGVIDNPSVVFEVLSPSTESFDRSEKFRAYEQAPSLQDYVLIKTDRYMVEVFRRQESGQWLRELIEGEHSQLELPSVGITLALKDLYQDVPLSPA